MVRYVCASLTAAAVAFLALSPDRSEGQGSQWGTIKGRIVWGGKDIPRPAKLEVKVDQAHCLAKGDLYDQNLVVDPKTRGLKWAFVWVAPEPDGPPLAIHPDLKTPKEKSVVLDQPMCMFLPRAIAMRQGQVLIVKNSAPVNHNIQWIGDGINNPGGNVTLPPAKEHVIKDLQPQKLPLMLRCNIHPWMQGRLAVFDHPYYAVTDDQGNFEIRNVPAGKVRLIAYQESIGWRGGAKGRAGQEVEVKAGGTVDLGALEMGK
jgi:hypothetical protein